MGEDCEIIDTEQILRTYLDAREVYLQLWNSLKTRREISDYFLKTLNHPVSEEEKEKQAKLEFEKNKAFEEFSKISKELHELLVIEFDPSHPLIPVSILKEIPLMKFKILIEKGKEKKKHYSVPFFFLYETIKKKKNMIEFLIIETDNPLKKWYEIGFLEGLENGLKQICSDALEQMADWCRKDMLQAQLYSTLYFPIVRRIVQKLHCFPCTPDEINQIFHSSEVQEIYVLDKYKELDREGEVCVKVTDEITKRHSDQIIPIVEMEDPTREYKIEREERSKAEQQKYLEEENKKYPQIHEEEYSNYLNAGILREDFFKFLKRCEKSGIREENGCYFGLSREYFNKVNLDLVISKSVLEEIEKIDDLFEDKSTKLRTIMKKAALFRGNHFAVFTQVCVGLNGPGKTSEYFKSISKAVERVNNAGHSVCLIQSQSDPLDDLYYFIFMINIGRE